jgi:hypothetical protein
MKIDKGDFTMEQVDELMTLYTKAVEHYNGSDNEKYMHWETRIQMLFLKPNLLMLTQGQQ